MPSFEIEQISSRRWRQRQPTLGEWEFGMRVFPHWKLIPYQIKECDRRGTLHTLFFHDTYFTILSVVRVKTAITVLSEFDFVKYEEHCAKEDTLVQDRNDEAPRLQIRSLIH